MEDASFADRIVARISADFFGQAILSNLVRPHYVERMIALALEPDWALKSADWAGWDLQRGDCRVEVKQSAALQTWSDRMSPGSRRGADRFDIRVRGGHWIDGVTWNAKAGRQADIYIFAWHGGTDRGTTDHRRAGQWEFYVVAERDLPAQKTISLARVRRMTSPVSLGALRDKLDSLAKEFQAAAIARAADRTARP